MLFVYQPKILQKHCSQFLLGPFELPRETEDNAYAKFWADKQRALWYFMIFSVVVNCFNNSFKIIHTAKQASSTNSRYDGMFSLNSSCNQLSGIFTFLAMFLGRRVWLFFFFTKRCLRHVLQLLNKQTNKNQTGRSIASLSPEVLGCRPLFWR